MSEYGSDQVDCEPYGRLVQFVLQAGLVASSAIGTFDGSNVGKVLVLYSSWLVEYVCVCLCGIKLIATQVLQSFLVIFTSFRLFVFSLFLSSIDYIELRSIT